MSLTAWSDVYQSLTWFPVCRCFLFLVLVGMIGTYKAVVRKSIFPQVMQLYLARSLVSCEQVLENERSGERSREQQQRKLEQSLWRPLCWKIIYFVTEIIVGKSSCYSKVADDLLPLNPSVVSVFQRAFRLNFWDVNQLQSFSNWCYPVLSKSSSFPFQNYALS